jgi:hypothetical protein
VEDGGGYVHGVAARDEEEAALGRRGEEEEAAGWATWAKRPAGRWAGWAESEGKFFFEENLIFEYTKALEICRRFRRNFDMRIFPKFF